MRILMFGRGVITTIYGWALAGAGHEVKYFVRPGKAARLGGKISLDLIDTRNGVNGKAVLEELEVSCVESLADLDAYDLVVVSVRHDTMRAAAEQLAAAPGPRGGFLFFNNCWDDPAAISSLLGKSPVVWGFPVAGGGFTGERHLAGALMTTVHLAQAEPANAGAHAQIQATFESAGLKVEVHPDFRAWLWLHFAVNAGMISQAIIDKQTSAQLVSSARQLSQAARLAREAVRVVIARGVDPRSHRAETAIATMPPLLAGFIAKSLAARNQATRRLMTIHTNERDLARFPLDVLSEARRLGIACPGLAAAEAPALSMLCEKGS